MSVAAAPDCGAMLPVVAADASVLAGALGFAARLAAALLWTAGTVDELGLAAALTEATGELAGALLAGVAAPEPPHAARASASPAASPSRTESGAQEISRVCMASP